MSCLDQKLTPECLTGYFREGIKKPSELAVGIEWEKIGVRTDSGRAIPYSGPAGVEAILQTLVRDLGWEPELQNGHPIALHKHGASITLEPGGQIELSGRIYQKLSDNAREIRQHLGDIRPISEKLGVTWLGIGAQPVSTASEIEWVPKERYGVMRLLLADRGELTYSMMKETASIQVSLDYTSEQDAMEKYRLALRLWPVLTAMFPNSPLEKGARAPYLSRRSHIWSRTAPERAGIPEKMLREDASFADYTEFALDVPMLFLKRDGGWHAVKNRTFRTFIEKGYQGLEATPADWELHLTGIFTEARLKHYVEIRSVDCQQTDVGLSVAALLKGLFYDAGARRAAALLLGPAGPSEITESAADARRNGLRATVFGKSALEIARELVRLAGQGLANHCRALGLPDETPYLKPAEEITAEGRTPAEKLLECSCHSGREAMRHWMDCARI